MRPLAVILAALLVPACAKQDERKPEEGPPPMKAEEQERGVKLCEGYVTRLCACADQDASLREPCDLARSQPEALKMPLALLNGAEGKLNDKERRLTEAGARKIIAACVKGDAALPLDRCPRP